MHALGVFPCNISRILSVCVRALCCDLSQSPTSIKLHCKRYISNLYQPKSIKPDVFFKAKCPKSPHSFQVFTAYCHSEYNFHTTRVSLTQFVLNEYIHVPYLCLNPVRSL